jgi:hypothetical protein
VEIRREFGQWPRELPASRTPIAGVEVAERLFLRQQLEAWVQDRYPEP